MKKIYMMLFVFVFALLSFLVAGCGDDPIQGVYDPNDKGRLPTPVITSITPSGVAYAVVDEMIIRGENFSPIPENNYLYFNITDVPIISASSTELRFQAPNAPSDTVLVRVAVFGAQLYSNTIEYKILPSFVELRGYIAADAFYAIESDAAGNIYVNLASGTATGRIDKIDTEGNKAEYGTIPFTTARSMKFGPDGGLYITRMYRAIYMIPPGGGDATTYFTMPTAQETVYDLDFDKDGNMWAVSNHATAASRRIAKLKDGAITGSYTFNAQLRAVKVYDDHLYFAGTDATDGNRVKIWRAPINNGELGTIDVYFDWASYYTSAINSITFALDGTLYVGTDGPDDETIIAISQNKVATPLYPGNMKSSTYNIIWGTGPNAQHILVSRRVNASGGHADNKIMKIYMAKNGAPYYGRN